MASRAKEVALAILIRAKDEASGIFTGVIGKTTALFAALSAFVGFRFFTGAIEEAGAFEKSMDRVIAKTDDGRQNADALKTAAETIGAQYKVSAQEAAEGLEILGAAGLKAKEAIDTLPAVMQLARTEGIGLEQAATLITDAVSIMGLSFADAGRAADVMAKAALLSNTTATEVGGALKYAGAEAKAAGLSLEQTAAVIDVLAQNGIRGEMAGTALRNILSQLQDPTSKARVALAGLGVSSSDLVGALDGIRAAGSAGGKAILAFGQEAGPALRALVAGGSAEVKSFADQLLVAKGSAENAAQAMSTNLTGAFDGLAAAWNALKRYLVEPLIEPLTRQVGDLTDRLRDAVSGGTLDRFRQSLVGAFNAAVESVKQFFGTLDFAAVAAKIQDFVSGAISTLQSLGTVGANVANALIAGWGYVAAAVATLIAGIQTLIAVFESGFSVITGILEKVGLLSSGFSERLRADAESWRTSAADWAASGSQSFESARAAVERLSQSSSTVITIQQAQAQTTKDVGAATDQATASLSALDIQTQTVISTAQAAAPALTGVGTAAQQSAVAVTQSATISGEQLALLKQRYEDLKATGTATPQQLAAALNEYNKALKETQVNAQEMSKAITEAYQVLGIQSAKELQNVAKQAEQAYALLRASGMATIGELNAGFEAMAEKMLEAARLTSPLTLSMTEMKLRAVAATEEQRKALEDLIARYEDVGSAAGDSARTEIQYRDSVISKVNEQTATMERLNSSLAQEAELRRQINAQGGAFVLPNIEEFARQLAMGTEWARQMETTIRNIGGQGRYLEIAYAKAAEIRIELDAAVQKSQNLRTPPKAPQPSVPQPSSTPSPPTRAAPAPTPAPSVSAPVQEVPSKTVSVTLTLPGVKPVEFPTTEKGANNLVESVKTAKRKYA